jgi:hypothetical protein
MKRRKREYVLYSMDRYALNLTNRADRADRLHRWVFTVYAYSIGQAYYVADKHMWAAGPGEVGIRRIALDRLSWDEEITTESAARAAGWIQDRPTCEPRAQPSPGPPRRRG